MNNVFPFRNQFCAMSSSQASWWPLTVAALTFITLVGCDVPTGDPSPSINTDTEISTPLVQEKTFTFLGGPNSEFDPLIDTTSSDFDSLFEVESSNNDISVVQKIDNFDIGNLNEALDNATGTLTFDQKTFDETFIDLQKEGFTFAGERQIGVLNVELQDSATANIPVRGSNRVAFKKSQNNYVELGPTTIEVQNITSSPTAPGGFSKAFGSHTPTSASSRTARTTSSSSTLSRIPAGVAPAATMESTSGI
ncbi:hypothetical protein [Salinibacter ruber]|uniref:hypothetical protein n=2 Tax=Salinibacter ruber TaxID=146919 RepID=UPI00207403A2|nr:hypothetical protein [Salinibacter ruber]